MAHLPLKVELRQKTHIDICPVFRKQITQAGTHALHEFPPMLSVMLRGLLVSRCNAHGLWIPACAGSHFCQWQE
jgi:hypothetical protein